MVAVVMFAVVVAVAYAAYRKGRAHGIAEAHRTMRRGEHLASREHLDGRNGERVTLIRITPPGHG